MLLPPRLSAHSARGKFKTVVSQPEINWFTFADNPMHYLYMIVKLLVFAGLITTLTMSEVSIFEKIPIHFKKN